MNVRLISVIMKADTLPFDKEVLNSNTIKYINDNSAKMVI